MKAWLPLFILALLLLGCTAPAPTPPPQETSVESPTPEVQVVEETPPLVEEPGIEEALPPAPEELVENTVPEPFAFFEPQLTYVGAYNGPLYATSEQIGGFADTQTYMENLTRNGVNIFIGMFAILGKPTPETFVSHEGLGYVAALAHEYPGRVVPFFGSGLGGAELYDYVREGPPWLNLYQDVLDTYPQIVGEDFIQGFGEVETQEWAIRHDHSNILKLVDKAEARGLHFMFHPVASKLDDVEALVEKYPDTIFLIHMYRDDIRDGRTQLIELMKSHENLFLSIDAAHIAHYKGNDILYDYADQYGSNAKSYFVGTVNNNYSSILSAAVKDFKPIVEAVPDKVMWGTEAGPEYAFDPEVYDLLVKISRDFIADVSPDPEVQADLGYRNAYRVFGAGVTLSETPAVIDSSSWPACKDQDIDKACASCGITDDEELSLEAEICENACLLKLQCFDANED